VFAVIAREPGRLMCLDHVRMGRFEEDGAGTTVASTGELDEEMPVGRREGRMQEFTLDNVGRANAELRELAHGILPSSLTRGGLRAAVDALVSRIGLPVHVDVAPGRYPPGIEASAYFVLAEALTTVMKHARAERADVKASASAGVLYLQVRDDGVGGASPDGHGLIGVEDRVTALGGRLSIDSPPGHGTVVDAVLPLPA